MTDARSLSHERDSPALVSVSEIAELLGVSRSNAYPWLRRRGIEPVQVDPLPVGRLYDRELVLAERDRWLGGRDRAQDERRSASAKARRA